MSDENLSINKSIKKITEELMTKEYEANEIIDIINKYLPDDFTEKKLRKIYLEGLKYSFQSSTPFYTAEIFCKNWTKCVPNAFAYVADTKAKMFKNMIMEKSPTKIVIHNYDEYKKIKSNFYHSFKIKPPDSLDILEAIIEDEKALNKIINEPRFEHKLKHILVDLETQNIQIFDNKIVTQINNKIKSLMLEKHFAVDNNKILLINKQINFLKNRINHLYN